VEAASQRYFGKNVNKINLPEAALLAAMPQAPSRYSPYGPHKDLLIERQHYIIDLMKKNGYISKEEADVAKGVVINFKEPTENITAPHFVMYIKEFLADKYGEKMVEQDGLKIYTTLDLYKQKIAEETVKTWAEKNEKEYDAKNAALVSLDPKTGQVLAMVGSRDYFNEDIDGQVNITTSLRQPGSSIKPIIYAASFAKGYTPNTVLYDVVTNFSTDPAKPYEPHNYDSKEHGPVTIRQALAGSLNIPAVKAIYLAGVDNVLNLAEELGYTSFKDRSRFGLSLVLGGGEVELIEHTNAFSAFAREGELQPITSILKIEGKDGKTIEETKEKKGKKVLDANIARMINSILSDNSARAFIFGGKNWLTLGTRPVAAKTGTTNDYRDAWTIGYTPSLVTGVWAGNSDNAAMKRGADGSKIAAPIWHDYMEKVLGNTPQETFNAPDIQKTGKPMLDGNLEGAIMVKIDKANGLLASEYTPENFIIEKQYREDHCILYYINKDEPLGARPTDPKADPQFDLWESRVRDWAAKQGFATSSPPTEYDNLHKQENRPEFAIESPNNNQIITEPILRAGVKASAPRGIGHVDYHINSNLFYSNASYPFNLEKNIAFLNNGYHKLKVRACDDIDNCSEKEIEFNLILSSRPQNTSININLLSPIGEAGVGSSSPPLKLKASVSNPEQTAKISFYYSLENNDAKNLIKSIYLSGSSEAETIWSPPLSSGIYKIFAEASGWNGQTAKSEEVKITVNQ
jgi:membrane peptidoglycan carboxypeptidase